MPSGSRSLRAHPQAGVRAEDAADARRFLLERETVEPVHVVVPNAGDRSQAKGLVCHVWAGPNPAGSYLKLGEGVYLSSPEMTFSEMAQELSLIELVRFGYILCGSYACDECSDRGFRKRVPLTSVQSLKRQVKKMESRHGVKKAARALRFIADGSASPMETILAMVLCLPRMIGGYGLDLPELNARIEARMKGLVDRDHFLCDLYWRKQRVAVEYDSDEHHSGAEAEARDSARRSALLSHGVTVLSVRPEQFFDARKFDETARAIAKLTGKRLPANDAGWMMKRDRLRRELLGDLVPSGTGRKS